MNAIDKLVNAGLDLASKQGATFGEKAVAALIGISAEQLQNILTALNQPSLCFIPIQSESLTMRRSVDIGTTMLISQVDQKKDFVTDNAAPRPRVWSGKGYISSLAQTIENGLLIKPTLQMQMSVLDAAADSRQPVVFKTDTGEVVKVLVQDLQISSSPKGAGVREVSYVVQEVKVLENSVMLGDSAWAASKAEAASIPIRAIQNLGKGSATTTGAVNTVAGLLGISF